MTERVAYQAFLGVVFGGLALMTLALLAIVVLLVRQNRRTPRRVRRRR